MNRPPIVTVMGHVDHGKTSLLDALRDTAIVNTESGGITQHIGASQVEYEGNKITFIDTPGHAAFSEMRSRGGKAADIVILVIAADDGVMPQTKEAISHAKAADVPIIVAINKIDLQNASVQKVKNQLLQEEVVLEEFGGETMCVEVSAEKKTNLDKLLESIVALSEIIENEDSAEGDLKGFVLESKHDPKKGYLATLIVTNGRLEVGDEITIGNRITAKIRSITSFTGDNLQEIEAGDPGEVLGLKELARSGEVFEKGKSEDLEEELNEEEAEEEDPFQKAKNEDLDVVLKADTQGTLEALVNSLEKIEHEGRGVNFLLKDVGDINESDLLLASVSKGIVLGFKVGVSSVVSEKAEDMGILVRTYDVIYELIEDVEGALEGIHEVEEEKIKGRAEIQRLFPLPSGDVVAGCKVTHGRVRDGDSVSVRSEAGEEGEEIFKTKIRNVKRGTEDITTAGKNTECGVLLNSGYDKLRPGYIIEVL